MNRTIFSCLVAVAILLTPIGRAPLSAGQGPAEADAQVGALLARVGNYLSAYIPLFSAVTAEEEYRQRFVRRPTLSWALGRPYLTGRRTLRSDFVLVRMPTAWMSFRDVLAVDGRNVRTPGNRLEAAFLDNWTTAVVRAADINDNCGQHDIGDVNRSLNHPAMVLQFLDLSNQPRFQFKRGVGDEVGGVRVSRIDYRETATPTFIAPDQTDTFTSGSVWVEPTTGRIVKTFLKLSYPRERRWLALQSTVVYRPVEGLGLWLPAEMQESWESEVGDTNTVATYTKYRRFTAPDAEK